ncbi:MAG: SRPBCC family protein [Deltaproteobacteria bacterium]|nr:SRPBCC family protein [Deltaproteobacteria bacterium]
MRVDVSSDIVIQRPPAIVAAFAANPDNAPAWYVNIKAVQWRSPPPLKVGARVAFVAQFLGRRLAYTYEIAEYVPETRMVMRTTEGPFPMQTSYTWEAAGDSETLMTLRNRGEPSGFGKLMVPFMVAAMRRANRRDLARLKDLLEGE